MGMTNSGLSFWQAETQEMELLETAIGDLLDQRAGALPTQEAVVYSCYPEFGEELLAVIIPKDEGTLTEAELRDFCKGQLSHQKIPRYFQFTTSLPLTGSGKVQKFVLREQAIKTLGLEEAAKTKTAWFQSADQVKSSDNERRKEHYYESKQDHRCHLCDGASQRRGAAPATAGTTALPLNEAAL